MKESKKNYWTDEHEQLVLDHIQENDSVKRSMIYNELRPTLIILIENILRRYYWDSVLQCGNDATDLVTDCETILYTKIFEHYNPDKGKAFSYFGTAIKRHFYNVFLIANTNMRVMEDIDEMDEQGNLSFDKSDFNEENDLDELKRVAIEKINEAIRSARKKNHKVILNTILDLVTTVEDYGGLYSTYYLLSRTRLHPHCIYNALGEHGLNKFIKAKWTLKRFETIIGEETDEEKIKTLLNSKQEMKKNEEYFYKITNKKKKRKKRTYLSV